MTNETPTQEKKELGIFEITLPCIISIEGDKLICEIERDWNIED